MVITGSIHAMFPTEQASEKFAKREFVVKYSDNPSYPQLIKFEATQERCAILDSFREGTEVEVTFNLRGREWINPQGEKKYFTSLEAWRVTKVEGKSGDQPTAKAERSVEDLANDDRNVPF